MAAKMLVLAAAMLTQLGQAGLIVQRGAVDLEDGVENLPTNAPPWANNLPDAPELPNASIGDMPQPPKRFGKPGQWWKETSEHQDELRAPKAKNTQITVVVNMIQKVKYGSQMDLWKADKAYDKVACLCRDQIAKAMESLGENKEVLAKHRALVKKYSAEIGSLTATVKQLAKEINDLNASLKENSDTRATELAAFTKANFTLTENVRAMGAAIAILNNTAGVPPEGAFLQAATAPATGAFLSFGASMQDKLMKVVSQIKPLVTAGTFPSKMKAEDVEVLKKFLDAPYEYISGGTGTSALQVGGVNGDFGNPSARIEGIMKTMQEGFQADLATAGSDEADAVKAYESLSLVKSQELLTNQIERQRRSGVLADTKKDMSTSKTLLVKTAKSEASDKKFFETTTAACKEKARMWSVSNRMRTEEIAGLDRAMYELGSEYMDTAGAAEQVIHHVLPPPPPPPLPMFLQLQETGMNTQQGTTNLQLHLALMKTFSKLKTLALKSHSVNVALVALEAKQSTSGVFDKLLPKIDDMVAVLRKEEQDDVKKKSYCKQKQKHLFSKVNDLSVGINRLNISVGKINLHNGEIDDYVGQIVQRIQSIDRMITSEKEQRKKEKELYLEDIADKRRASSMMENAITEMEKVYKNNLAETRVSHLQVQAQGAKPARRLQGKGTSHSGQQEETNTIVDMLTMLQQDISNEIKEDEVEDHENQKNSEKKVAGLNEKWRDSQALKADALKDRAAGDSKKADLQGQMELRAEDKIQAQSRFDGNQEDCRYLLRNDGFATRRSNRKAEIQGLQDAKDVLAGKVGGA